VHAAHHTLLLVVLHLVHHFAILLEDRERLEVTGLSGSVVATGTVNVLGSELLEFSKLEIRDGHDLAGHGNGNTTTTANDSGRSNVGNEVLSIHKLVGEEAEVHGHAHFTLLVSGSPGIEDGGDEWVVHVTSVMAIEMHDYIEELIIFIGHCTIPGGVGVRKCTEN